jgi:hypothetical protein
MSQSSWLVAGMVRGVERQPLKKLEPDEDQLLNLMNRWRHEALRTGHAIERLVVAYEEGMTLDQLLSGRDPKEVFSKDGLFDELKKALAERVLNAELDDHLDGEGAAGKANYRNGYSKKTVLTETSKIDIKIARDREGTFDPKLIQRYERRFPGFEEKIVSMYARGMTVREIQGHLLDLYGLEVSAELVSTITDAVLETAKPAARDHLSLTSKVLIRAP